jgi:hypothetical protein
MQLVHGRRRCQEKGTIGGHWLFQFASLQCVSNVKNHSKEFNLNINHEPQENVIITRFKIFGNDDYFAEENHRRAGPNKTPLIYKSHMPT